MEAAGRAIDVSSAIGHWAFSPLRRTSAGELAAAMPGEGVASALVSPAEGICCQNPHLVIEEHFRRVEKYPCLVPVPVINPMLADACAQAEYCFSRGAPAVKLYPNYHGYGPACREARHLLEKCGGLGMAVMFQMRVEDVRRQHRVMNTADTGAEDVLEAAESCPGVKIVLCGVKCREITGEAGDRILRRDGTYIETSFLECLDTLNTPECTLGFHYERLFLGTHSPFFYMRANLLKLKALENRPEQLRMVSHANAAEALGLKAAKMQEEDGGP